MTTVQPIPQGYHTITPYLAVEGARRLLDFLEAAFGAEVKVCSEHEGVIMNAEVKIGTSMVMVADNRGRRPTHPAMLYMYVKDVDAAYERAVKAGGRSVLAPIDHFYGDRSGAVTDPAGNEWWIATHVRDVPADELKRHMVKEA